MHACHPITYIYGMHVHQRKARPTVTILKNTSSSTIVINRLEKKGREKNIEMKERILDLYVYDSWDHPVGHRHLDTTLIVVN
jgi:ribose 1,5-bisphosphokinase PhnN